MLSIPCLSHICSGLLPMLYKMDKKPDWNVLRNILQMARGMRMRLANMVLESAV